MKKFLLFLIILFSGILIQAQTQLSTGIQWGISATKMLSENESPIIEDEISTDNENRKIVIEKIIWNQKFKKEYVFIHDRLETISLKLLIEPAEGYKLITYNEQIISTYINLLDVLTQKYGTPAKKIEIDNLFNDKRRIYIAEKEKDSISMLLLPYLNQEKSFHLFYKWYLNDGNMHYTFMSFLGPLWLQVTYESNEKILREKKIEEEKDLKKRKLNERAKKEF